MTWIEQEQRRIDRMVKRVINDPPSLIRSLTLLGAECALDELETEKRGIAKMRKLIRESLPW